jgi:uncharacterized protein (DUF1800 family)
MRTLTSVCALVLAFAAAGLRSGMAAASSDDTSVIEHVLSRITYGIRPGDVARVRAVGLDRFVDEQLHPERINDAPLERRLETLTTLRLSSGDIAARYEEPLIAARRARRNPSAGSANPDAPEMMAPEARDANRVALELGEAKILRAVYSERQLQEVLTDFWFNHFNVDARKGPDRFMLTEYERDVIRPRVFGRFRDLLGATAKSPAMLFYLDNWMSGRAGGVNENYARELMELHTLGVDGGYTQRDVEEVARCFTGWTIDRPREGGGFRFAPRLHDDGEKIVLGHRIRAGGGERDGEQVLDILASSPATARHIAAGLVERFVSDTPPASLVDRATARFLATDGDLREVMRTILTSPEFLDPGASPKARNPLEFVAAAVRATGGDVADARPLVREVQTLGMPLYQCQPPTGYPDTAAAWLSAGALVGRMNFAVALAANRVPGVTIDRREPAEALALRLGGPDFQLK